MRIARVIASLAATAALLAACGDDTPEGPPADTASSLPPVTDGGVDVSIEGSWRLVDGTIDGAPVAVVDGFDVTLDVTGDSVGGRAACNSYGGTVRVGTDGSIAVGALAATEMACQPAVMDVEQAVLGALPAVTSYELTGGDLILTGPAISLTFESLAPPPTADIVGTTWVLDTVIEGNGASSVQSSSAPAATLRLAADGSLDGSTGCRRLSGEWIESGSEILFVTFSAIDDPAAGACAPESERLDGFIVTVLGDGFTAEVDEDRLTVTSQGGDGLMYRAHS